MTLSFAGRHKKAAEVQKTIYENLLKSNIDQPTFASYQALER